MLNIKSNLRNKKLTETIQQTTTQNDVCLLKEILTDSSIMIDSLQNDYDIIQLDNQTINNQYSMAEIVYTILEKMSDSLIEK